jgi:NAD(P)-dependent dehydrogenase (short-subunit alcohol dehydrogenase family)
LDYVLQQEMESERIGEFGSKTALWMLKAKQHCYVTGGSEGLGLETAIELANKGANISIVARTQSKLDKALIRLEVCLDFLHIRKIDSLCLVGSTSPPRPAVQRILLRA